MKFKKAYLLGVGLLLTFTAGVCVQNDLGIYQEVIKNGHAVLGNITNFKAKILNEVNQLISTAKITTAILLGILGSKIALLTTVRGPTLF